MRPRMHDQSINVINVDTNTISIELNTPLLSVVSTLVYLLSFSSPSNNLIFAQLFFTFTIFVLAVFISGFLFKFVLYLTGASLPFTRISSLLDLLFGIDPIDEMSSFDLDSWGYRPPQSLHEVFFSGLGDAAHWALGVIGLALWGFVSVMTGLGAFGIHLRLGNWRRRGEAGERRRRGGTMGAVMWGIVILIGTARFFSPPFGVYCGC